MTKKIPLWLSLLLIVLAIVVTFQATFILTEGYKKTEAPETVDPNKLYHSTLPDSILKKLEYYYGLYETYYAKEYDIDEVSDYIIYGLAEGMNDRFGGYVEADDLAEYESNIGGEYEGIGVSVINDSTLGALEITSVFPDSPALEAGVLPGDLVIYVGDESVAELGYYSTIAKMRGEAGTAVTFTVARGDDYSEKVEFTIERRHVTEMSVLWHMLETDSRVATIKITQFNVNTPEQFAAAVSEAVAAGAQGIIMDVRNNPGGDLNSICKILDSLLPEGPIIRIDYKTGQDQVINSDAEQIDIPISVLVNGNTASAGELFASAIKDYQRGLLVGEQTYGKGTMQRTIKYTDGSALALTVAYYAPPYSDNYDGVGVTPDIVVSLPEEAASKNILKLTEAEDVQLQAAIAALMLEETKK